MVNGDSEEATAEFNTMANLRDTVEIPDLIRDEVTESLFPGQLFENLTNDEQDVVAIEAREVAWARLSEDQQLVLEESFNEFADDRRLRNEIVTFTELATIAPELIEDAGWIEEHWIRVRHKVGTIINFRHPVHHTVVQVQAVNVVEAEAGQAPPRPTVNPSEPVISVVMTRDLGNVRFPPFMVSLGSLIIFLVLCYLLHVRDQDAMARRSAFEAEKAMA